jgi:hypothetical protein
MAPPVGDGTDHPRVEGDVARRRIVANDNPEPPSEIRTTLSLPGRGLRWAITNAITSVGRT